MRFPDKIILSVFFMSVMIWAANDTTATSKTTKPVSDTLIVQARLLEIPGTLPPNDLYNYVYVMKYRVTKVIQGTYDGKVILIGHYNPLISRNLIKDKMAPYVKGTVEKFEPGAKQRLVLVPLETVWNDAVESEYFDSELPVFFALTADVAK